MEANRNYINENIVNISLMAGKLMADGKISVEDHAELTDHIVALAESFEVSHKDIDYNAQVKAGEPAPDYVEDIDAFAEKALTASQTPISAGSVWMRFRIVCVRTLISTLIPSTPA